MRIAKNTTQLISEAPSLRFMLVVDVMDGAVSLEKESQALLSLALDKEGSVCATLNTPSGVITLSAPNAAKREVILTASYARYGLYVDGVLTDEDFFLSPIDYIGATVKAGSFMHFEAGYEYHSMTESAVVKDISNSFDGFCPFGRDMSLHAPLPVLMKDRLHVFYLDARREGSVKQGMGANRLCAVFTEDGRSISSAPIALPIDSVEEKRIVDAAAVTVGERTYLYYLVDYRTHRALTAAVSDDGYSFLKTGLDIVISGVENENIDSLTAFEENGEAFLAFTVGSKAFVSKSEDLLYFKEPRPLDLPEGISHIYALPYNGSTVFFAAKDGITVYGREGEKCKTLPGATARPILFDGKVYLFEEKNGRLSAQIYNV